MRNSRLVFAVPIWDIVLLRIVLANGKRFVLGQASDRRLYAETLIALAGRVKPKPSPLLVAFFGRERVFARIRYILHSEEAPMSWSRSLAQAVVLGLAVLGGLLAFVSPLPKAKADPVVPPKLAMPAVRPQTTLPGPAVAPQPVSVLPSAYTQKPQVIIGPKPQEDPQDPRLRYAQPQPQEGATVPGLELRELQAVRQTAKRSWGPEQAEGPPDTEGAGDIQTAWASQTQDGQKEWLICEYPEAVMPTAVAVYETYNPGTLEKVGVFDEAGKEHMAWMGTDPTPRTAARGTSVIPIKTKFKVQKVKLYFDSPAVPGWNEIDAVALKAKDNTQWAEKVTASSTYAQAPVPQPPAMVMVPAEDLKRLKELDQEVKALKKEMQRMKQIEADLKELKELVKDLKK